MRSTYWVGQYKEGGTTPRKERDCKTLAEARRIEHKWDNESTCLWARVLRVAPDGNLYALRTWRSQLPQAVQDSLRAQGYTPAE